ncbi:MAG TPA: DUF2090 domain-containing protein, partial [Paracoccus sp. (in: a-proteobacteria)]|nr:DUF2090 domain-containing protein [Paracoccus sp. (in: a-proteobacteria)]
VPAAHHLGQLDLLDGLGGVERAGDGQGGHGILCDNRIGKTALHAASGTGLWIGRPCEWPGSRPLELEPELGADCGGLEAWARENVV